MAQKSPSKFILLHPIENHRTTCQKTKNSPLNTTQNISTNTDNIQLNRDISTNTPNYAEQMAKALDNGNAAEEIVQMLMQNEASESYWKLMTERRKEAIEETIVENQQLHNLIDDLSKENEQLRILSGHCDYLQNVLNSFTNEHDSLLDDSSTN
ncbi:unnamed protein product [Rotaria sp. Silwood1]|nr:unnamed protein product [Rotaria sp. Silwood1]CAF3395404.1 unnamed protein product [Rotaria sp. Silwood1]CAF3412780.1 unnamed protein product [Rotaria sp. Silwood1]CAF3419341.1 unnamed protein product [Rotaria sp. Silwood1]CAF4673288.1 unnamed protein product [Rotaria sp. Silwood1]